MKIPFNEAETLNYIIQEENLELSWINKQLGIGKSTIFSTEDLAIRYEKKVLIKESEFIFKPYKANLILLAIAGLIFVSMMINALIKNQVQGGFPIFAILFVCIFIIIGISSTIIDKERNF